jgi:DNA polymerase-3 subunit chi
VTEVLFYHLSESTLEEALPPLLEKSLQRGWKVVVQVGSEERRDALDQHLWTYRDDSFLAHGTEHDSHADRQPILLTTGQGNANSAQIRFMGDGAIPPDLSTYQRAVFMFDGHDMAQVEQSRSHWKAVRAGGHSVTYWQQTADRRWEKKA